MEIIKCAIPSIVLMFANPSLASHFCLEAKDGLHCDYNTDQGCEADKGPNEFCSVNPREMDTNEEKETYILTPEEKEPYCHGTFFGTVCVSYPQEPCSEEERRDDDFKCDFNGP